MKVKYQIILVVIMIISIASCKINNNFHVTDFSKLFIKGINDTSFTNIESISSSINDMLFDRKIPQSLTIQDNYCKNNLNELICYEHNDANIDICDLVVCISSKDSFNFLGEKHESSELQQVVRENMINQTLNIDFENLNRNSRYPLMLQIYIRASTNNRPSSKEWLLMFQAIKIYINTTHEIRENYSIKKYGMLFKNLSPEKILNTRKTIPIRIAINFINSECSILQIPDSSSQNIYEIMK